MMSEPATGVKNSQVFRKRTITTLIGVPVVAAVIWFGSPWFTILAAAWAAGAANEFYGLVKRARGLNPLIYFGLLWVVLFVISPHVYSLLPPVPAILFTPSFLLATSVILPLVILLWRRGKENAFANWAWTVAGILYIGWLLSYIVALRITDDGRGWVFLAVLCTFASDIAAYLTGRAAGRHKMAPYISPNKTWEGAIGGVVGSIIISIAVVILFDLPLVYWQAVLLGVLVSVVGQLGDLVKSLFKRNVEVKDSGNVLPGHGGFLDRMDSLAFAGVTVYYFVVFVMHNGVTKVLGT
jgi:phosphatidate cytidylyltransferase